MFREEFIPDFGRHPGIKKLYTEAGDIEFSNLINSGVSKKFTHSKLYISFDSGITAEEAYQKIKEAIYEYDIYKLCYSLFMRNKEGWVVMNNLSRVTSGLDNADEIEYDIYKCYSQGESNILSQLGILYHSNPTMLKEKYPNYYTAIKRLIKMFAPKRPNYPRKQLESEKKGLLDIVLKAFNIVNK